MKLVRPEIEIKNTKIVKSLKRSILINIIAIYMTFLFPIKLSLVLAIKFDLFCLFLC